jgi:hypothetical protein
MQGAIDEDVRMSFEKEIAGRIAERSDSELTENSIEMLKSWEIERVNAAGCEATHTSHSRTAGHYRNITTWVCKSA